jgi:hypothetical protein
MELIVQNLSRRPGRWSTSCYKAAPRISCLFILARGVNANYWNDRTPLGVATLTNQPIMVKMLLGLDSTDLTTEPEALSKGRPRQSKGYVEVNTTASFDENATLLLTAMHNLP